MESSLNFIKCFICSENIKDSRMLPCLHSFCYECLKSKFNRDLLNKIEIINCPKCNSGFELPEKGLESLKKNEFVECLTEAIKLSCGTCSKLEIANFCLNCKLYLCSSCTSVHEKIPMAKDHVLAKINSSKNDIEATYCKSCQKWIHSEKNSDHIYCTLIKFSNFKEIFNKNLQQAITDKNYNIDVIVENLCTINAQKLSASKEAENIKEQVQQHCDDIQKRFIEHINLCNKKIKEEIDQTFNKTEENLDIYSKKLLKIKSEFENKNSKYKNMLQQLDPVILIQAIENENVKVLETDENTLLKSQNLFMECLKEELKLSFEPNRSHDEFLVSQYSMGKLMLTDQTQRQLIKTIKFIPDSCNFSVSKTKLYVATISDKNLKIYICCSETFDQLSSNELHISNTESLSYKLNRNLLFWLNDSFLNIYNLEKTKPLGFCEKNIFTPLSTISSNNNFVMGKSVKLGFNGGRIISTSETSLFIIEEMRKRVFETTTYGEIVHIITIPECLHNSYINGLVHLNSNRFAVSSDFKLYLISCKGDVIKEISSGNTPNFGASYAMITDNKFSLFVADFENRKIHEFDFKFNFIQSFEARCKPFRLCYDSTKSRLLAFGWNDWLLSVFQL